MPTHPKDYNTTTAPADGDGQESSLRKINLILAGRHRPVPLSAVKQVTIAGTAGTLAGLGGFAFSAAAKVVDVTIETAQVRVDTFGGTPTASNGVPINPTQTVRLTIAEALAGKWIRTTATSAVAQVQEYGV